MNDTNEQIRAKIEAFVQELAELTRTAALDAVRAALGGSVREAARVSVPRAPAARARKAAQGGKRTSDQVTADAEKVLVYVKANAGCSVEQMGAKLGLSTKEMRLPIQKLLAERSLKTTGQKRGTRYFAGGAAAKSAKSTTRAAGKPPPKTAPKTAPKAKRKPLSPEQRKALLERLANARAARASKRKSG